MTFIQTWGIGHGYIGIPWLLMYTSLNLDMFWLIHICIKGITHKRKDQILIRLFVKQLIFFLKGP